MIPNKGLSCPNTVGPNLAKGLLRNSAALIKSSDVIIPEGLSGSKVSNKEGISKSLTKFSVCFFVCSFSCSEEIGCIVRAVDSSVLESVSDGIKRKALASSHE